MADGDALRIGELSRRSGVSPELLRAWERRYGLLRPERSPGGLRLYSPADLERVRLMRRHLARGLAAAEAAAAALRDDVAEPAAPATADGLDALRDELGAALEAFDEPRAQAVLDRLVATVTLDALLSEVVLPYLHDLGARWERGEVSVAQEHFASNVLRGRLLGLARDWGRGVGPLAVLACAPGEQHDLGLLAFGVALHARGWRIAYLGVDAPIDTVLDACERLAPELVVVNAVTPERLRPALPALRELAGRHRLAIGGAAARGGEAAGLGALALTGGPVAEAERVAALAAEAEGVSAAASR